MIAQLVPEEIIKSKIYFIRNTKVILDSDLALLYGVETKVLNQSVKRNKKRFPDDFMFQLTDQEWETLKSQIVTSMESRGGRRFNPYVFTEYGVLMLSNIVNSNQAIFVSIQIIRVFIKLREMVLSQNELANQFKALQYSFFNYAKENNLQIEEIFRQLDYLMDITKPSKIGFKLD